MASAACNIPIPAYQTCCSVDEIQLHGTSIAGHALMAWERVHLSRQHLAEDPLAWPGMMASCMSGLVRAHASVCGRPLGPCQQVLVSQLACCGAHLGLVQHDAELLVARGQVALLALQRGQDAPVALLLLLGHTTPSISPPDAAAWHQCWTGSTGTARAQEISTPMLDFSGAAWGHGVVE